MNRKRIKKASFLHIRMRNEDMEKLKERRTIAGYDTLTEFVCDILVNSREDQLIYLAKKEIEYRKTVKAKEVQQCNK